MNFQKVSHREAGEIKFPLVIFLSSISLPSVQILRLAKSVVSENLDVAEH